MRRDFETQTNEGKTVRQLVRAVKLGLTNKFLNFQVLTFCCQTVVRHDFQILFVCFYVHGTMGIGEGVAAVLLPTSAPFPAAPFAAAAAIRRTKSSVRFASTSIDCRRACRHSRRFSISAAR